MKTPFGLLLVAILLAPAAYAQQETPDSTTLQTMVLLDGTILTAAITDEDRTRYTVVTLSGEMHTIPKAVVTAMGRVGTTPLPVVRIPEPVLASVEPAGGSIAEELAPTPVHDSAGTALALGRFEALRSDIRHNWDVGLTSGDRFLSVGLAGLRNDSLIIRGDDGETAISPANLESMRRDMGGHFWTGAAIGGGTGMAVGVVAARAFGGRPDADDLLVSASVLGLLGGAIGALVDDSEEFDFRALEEQQKADLADQMLQLDRFESVTPDVGAEGRDAGAIPAVDRQPTAIAPHDDSSGMDVGRERVEALRADLNRNWQIELWSGARLDSVGLAGLRDSSLVVSGKSAGATAIPLANLAVMRRNNGVHFWTGAAVGGASFLFLVLAIDKGHIGNGGVETDAYFKYPPLGALVGGLIGTLFEDSDDFDLRQLEQQEKTAMVEELLRLDRR